MNPFLQQTGPLRRVKTRRGDTLQKVASRELGDASLWTTLIGLNHLKWPFLTDDANPPAGVLRTGSAILVPASSAGSVADVDVDPVKTFGIDVDLTGGVLHAVDGDFGVVSGNACLVQGLNHRLETHTGDLTFHKDFGCQLYILIGRGGTRPNATLANAFVQRAVGADPRILDTDQVQTTITGDIFAVTGRAIATDGTAQPVNFQS